MMKVIVDSLGGDLSPKEVLLGCADALKENKELELVVVGEKETILKGIGDEGGDISRVEVIEATEAVLNTDHPANFLREKPNSSLAVLFETAKQREDIQACVSAGPTGAVLTGAIFKLGRLKGVKRPALIACMPTRIKGKVAYLLDAGANMDCKSEYLLQFALMADAYLKADGIESPKIGLLNVGAEEGKGNEVTKAAFALLKEAPINFVGNIEGDHVIDGEADIIVCDGFWGNVYCKGAEGVVSWTTGLFKEAFMANFKSKLAALLMKGQIKKVKQPIKHALNISAPLLGVSKLVLKCHGKSNRETFRLAILDADKLMKERLSEKIAKAIESVSLS